MIIHGTIGLLGDFPRWSDAWRFLMGIAPLVNDYHFRQIGLIFEDNWPPGGWGELAYNGHTVKFYCNWADSHQGDPTRGLVTLLDAGVRGTICMRNLLPYSQNDTSIVENLWIQKTGAGGILKAGAWGANKVCTINFNNLLIRGTGEGNGIYVPVGETYAKISVCKVWNCNIGIHFGIGAGLPPYPGRRIVEHVTTGLNHDYGFSFGTEPGNEWIMRNSVAYNNGSRDYHFHCVWPPCPALPRIDIRNSADSDGTCEGTNIEHNIIPANHFKHHLLVDDNQPDFLDIKKNSITVGEGGTPPTLVTLDIKGNPIENPNGTYPMGCHAKAPIIHPIPIPEPISSWMNLSRTQDKFLLKPDWKVLPKRFFDENREVLKFPGTTINLYNLGDDLSKFYTYGYKNFNRRKEYQLVDFFCKHRGMHKRFWIPLWKNAFTLASPISEGDSYIEIDQCFFHRIDRGYERIYIELKNGLFITRSISVVIDNGTTEDLRLDTVMDRDITQEDITFFGRFLLVRFDMDDLDLSFLTDDKTACILKFKELVHEYEEES